MSHSQLSQLHGRHCTVTAAALSIDRMSTSKHGLTSLAAGSPTSGMLLQGGNTQNVYENVAGVFVNAGNFLPADVGVICNLKVDCGTVKGALEFLAENDF